MILTKFSQLNDLRSLLSDLKKLVVTNGCFDVLHIGHVDYLNYARTLGDFLLVGINDDDGVYRLKGVRRPINTAQVRARMLDSLRCVDAVFIFNGHKATQFLRHALPCVYVKGSDYTLDKLDPEERSVLERINCKISFFPLVPAMSTSAIIRKLTR